MRARRSTPTISARHRSRALSLLVCGLMLVVGCASDDVRSLGWQIEFASDALRERAVFVEGRILEGGCASSSVRYAAEVRRGAMPEAAPRLEAGRYGFEASARDAECVWFASACVEVDVPQPPDHTVRITLASTAAMPACSAAMCADGVCDAIAVDAAAPDAAPIDAGPGECEAPCAECTTCVAGACVPDDGTACGDGTGTCRAGACCTGCWSAAGCQPGDAVLACGELGAACETCGGATPFCDRACVGPREVARLGATAATLCAVGADGTLWCWGSNTFGQLGVGTTGMEFDSTVPVRVGVDDDWVQVEGGRGHFCGVRADGTLWCWGEGSDGQLGHGERVDLSLPMRVEIAGAWTHVRGAMGGEHTCALRDDDTLWCTGRNADGQLGLGDTTLRSTLVRVAGTWRAIALGNESTCAIATAGTLWCWGDNERGQLGQGTSGVGTGVTAPTQIGTASDWTAIASGEWHACGVRAGELYCWGYNVDAQLGIGSTTLTPTPERVGTETTWAEVTAGSGHTCATRTDGTLWCWGKNDAGQLGIGRSSTTDERTPVQVGSDTDWALARTGYLFTCGLRAGGAVLCTGANDRGQLGQGDHLSRSRPTEVLLPRP